jgi:hypothetical protein
MKLITQRDLIRKVAERWHQQYDHYPEDDRPLFSVRNGMRTQLNKREIASHLDMLNKETATADDVNTIIGNKSWTRLTCDECGSETITEVMEVGQEPDYESNTARLCLECIKKAYIMTNMYSSEDSL